MTGMKAIIVEKSEDNQQLDSRPVRSEYSSHNEGLESPRKP